MILHSPASTPGSSGMVGSSDPTTILHDSIVFADLGLKGESKACEKTLNSSSQSNQSKERVLTFALTLNLNIPPCNPSLNAKS